MATRTAPITKQVAIDGTRKHLGDVITEDGKFRLVVPTPAASAVWLGDKDVTSANGDRYAQGTATQLPTTSLEGWYAVTDGTPVTITITCATGGADAPDWVDAGTTSGTGSVLATEQTLQTVVGDTTALAGTVRGGPGTTNDQGVGAHILSAPILLVEVIAGQTATATPDPSAQGIVARLAGITSDAVGETGTGLHVGAYQKEAWSVDQGAPVGADKAWPTRLVDTGPRAARVTGQGELHTAERRVIFTFTATPVERGDIFGFVGTGTHGIDAARRAQYIAVSGADGESQALQSHTRYPLPPSMPFQVIAAFMLENQGAIGQTIQLQLGEDDDCFGLEIIDGEAYVFVQSGLTGMRSQIPRAFWLDPLDGFGPSGMSIDWTLPTTIEAVAGVPGASAIYAELNGTRIVDLAPFFNLVGILRRSIQPVRARILNTAATTPGAIYLRSFSVYALGDFKFPTDVQQVPPTDFATRTISNVYSPLIAVRVKSTIGGSTYRGFAYPKEISITNKSVSARLDCIVYRNPTSITGASWQPVAYESGIEYDVSATSVDLTGARSVGPIVVPSGDTVDKDLTAMFEQHYSNLIRNRVDGVSDMLVIMAKTSIASADVSVAMTFDEVAS